MGSIILELSTLIFSLIIIIGFFQNWLITINPLFGFIDEVLAIFSLLYYLIYGKKTKDTLGLVGISFIITTWGLFCNINFEIQNSIMAIIGDAIGTFKFIYMYIGLKSYLERHTLKTGKILNIILVVIKTYILLLFGCAICNFFMDIGMDAGIRYGLRMFSFVYGTPGHLINQMSYVLLLLVAECESKTYKRNRIWFLMVVLIMISTMKTRAFLLIIIYLGLFYFIKIQKGKSMKIRIGIIGIIIALIGQSQFEYYFLNVGTPRQMFVAGAVKLVKQYFPFGTGFGTYGSSTAADYYSRLYYDLGFSTRWGMTKDHQLFLNDNYLPMIFAQFGFIFAFLFLYLVYKYCIKILKDRKKKDTEMTKIITWFFILDIIISSIQSSYLAHYSVVTITFIFVLFFYPDAKDGLENIGQENSKNDKKNENCLVDNNIG